MPIMQEVQACCGFPDSLGWAVDSRMEPKQRQGPSYERSDPGTHLYSAQAALSQGGLLPSYHCSSVRPNQPLKTRVVVTLLQGT